MPSEKTERRAAWALIAIGVLAWVPYFYQLGLGENPSFMPYLAVHLAGVLSGAWLRKRSTPQIDEARGRGRKRAARALVILGVLAWAPYIYLNQVAGRPQPLAPYLTAHLIGVLGGSALRISLIVERYLRANGSKTD